MNTDYSNNNYNKNLKEYARKLRNNSTLAEVILWNKLLKRKQLRGYSFLRQRPLDNYIVDFFSKDLKLVIEIDGEIHKFQKGKDKIREERIRNLGYSVIRFQNEDILYEFINVIRTLEGFVDEFEKKIGMNLNSPLNPLKGKLRFKTVYKKLEIKIK
jgi:very-short-patch-repair endonuclease